MGATPIVVQAGRPHYKEPGTIVAAGVPPHMSP